MLMYNDIMKAGGTNGLYFPAPSSVFAKLVRVQRLRLAGNDNDSFPYLSPDRFAVGSLLCAVSSQNSSQRLFMSAAEHPLRQSRASAAHKAHNLEVTGSTPVSATILSVLYVHYLLNYEVPRLLSGNFVYIRK